MASFSVLATLLCTLLCFSQADLVADVCSKAENPTLCTQVLRSDPRSSRADLRGLGQIILEKAAAATKNVAGVAKSFSGGGDGGGSGAAEVCAETCGNSIDALNKCSELLKGCGGGGGASCKADLNNQGSAAYTNIDTCDDAFKESGGGAEPAKLKEATKRAEDLIDVFLVIANTL